MRIKGLYLAIATLAGQLIIEWTINHVPAISGGVQASIEVPRPDAVRHQLQDASGSSTSSCCSSRCWPSSATLNLVRSRIGRAFIAIRDQDIAAEIIGINIFRYKLLAFAISSFYAGVTGVLYTYYFGIANYEQFQIGVSIDYLAMIIIGGLGSVLGSIFGAIFVTMLPIVTALVMETFGGLFFSAGELLEHHPEPAAGPVRRPDHLLSDRRAGGAEPAVAQHPQLLPGLAIFATEYRSNEAKEEMHANVRRCVAGASGSSRPAPWRWRPAPAPPRRRRS